jgi:hypothetical protein
MPDPENGVLVYAEDGTPYYIPTNSLAQFQVTGDALAKLQAAAAGDAPEEATSPLAAYQLEDIGPGPLPDWPIGCRPN